jgi:hypothetical protein
VQEAEVLLSMRGSIQTPIRAHSFQKVEGTRRCWSGRMSPGPWMDAVHMGFRRKIHDGARLVLSQQIGDQGRIADVALYKHMA